MYGRGSVSWLPASFVSFDYRCSAGVMGRLCSGSILLTEMLLSVLWRGVGVCRWRLRRRTRRRGRCWPPLRHRGLFPFAFGALKTVTLTPVTAVGHREDQFLVKASTLGSPPSVVLGGCREQQRGVRTRPAGCWFLGPPLVNRRRDRQTDGFVFETAISRLFHCRGWKVWGPGRCSDDVPLCHTRCVRR